MKNMINTRNTQVPFVPNIYYCAKRDLDQLVTSNTARKNKSKALAGLVKATEFCGTTVHQAVALHDLLTEKKPELGVALGVLPDPDLAKEVGS
jgi:hypothetical protein